MCINTQLITVSNGEERFKAGQWAGPLSAQHWKLHQMKLYAFLPGTKAISSAGPEWETHHWAFLRHHSFSYFETEQIKCFFFFVPSGEYKSGCDSFMKSIRKRKHPRMTTLTVTEAAQPVMRDEVCILLMVVPSACSSWSQNKHNLTVAARREQSKWGHSKVMAVSNNASPFTRRFTVFTCKSGIYYRNFFFIWGSKLCLWN